MKSKVCDLLICAVCKKSLSQSTDDNINVSIFQYLTTSKTSIACKLQKLTAPFTFPLISDCICLNCYNLICNIEECEANLWSATNEFYLKIDLCDPNDRLRKYRKKRKHSSQEIPKNLQESEDKVIKVCPLHLKPNKGDEGGGKRLIYGIVWWLKYLGESTYEIFGPPPPPDQLEKNL